MEAILSCHFPLHVHAKCSEGGRLSAIEHLQYERTLKIGRRWQVPQEFGDSVKWKAEVSSDGYSV